MRRGGSDRAGVGWVAGLLVGGREGGEDLHGESLGRHDYCTYGGHSLHRLVGDVMLYRLDHSHDTACGVRGSGWDGSHG